MHRGFLGGIVVNQSNINGEHEFTRSRFWEKSGADVHRATGFGHDVPALASFLVILADNWR